MIKTLFNCKKCNKTFESSNLLTKHKAEHTNTNSSILHMRNSTGNNSTLSDLLLCEDVSLETANSEEEKGEVAELDDFVGSSENNYKLGLKRANAVIESLVNTFSIDINRLIADSQGENNLLANESQKMKFQTTSDGLSQTKSFKSLNRRVEFIIE